MRIACLFAVLALATGCGLVLDTAPPDPKPDQTTPPTTCTADAQCNDGNVCNGIEGCVAGTCVITGRLSCDDHIGCTTDTCDPASSACVHTPSSTVCTGGAICDPSASPTATPTGCVVPKSCTSNDQCLDTNPCNGTETCQAGHCVPGTAIVCPSNGCQRGVCSMTDGSCSFVAADAACEDGVTCTTGTCGPQGTCAQTLENAACADAYSCTKDLCTGKTNGTDVSGCIHYTDDSVCQTTTAVCVEHVCAPAGAPQGSTTGCAERLVPGACATGTRCNFDKDACEPLPTDCTACDDGNPCNGVETCVTTTTSDAGTYDAGITGDAAITMLDGSILALDAALPGTGGTCVTTVDGCPTTAVACQESYCNLSGGTPVCSTRVSSDLACWALPAGTTIP